MKTEEALKKLRAEKERKFDQTVDLIVNLRGVDLKKDNINVVVDVPHLVKERKVCGFLTKKSDLVDSVLDTDFVKYKDPKKLKELAEGYDFFIAAGPLMPKVATTFGKVLGPAGKMPSPQLGILMPENDENIKKTLEKIGKSVKLRAKEPSIKLAIGKLSMDDAQIIENINSVCKALIAALPAKEESVKNIMLKLTMAKPEKVEVGK